MKTKRLNDIDDDTLIRALTDPDVQDLDTDTATHRMKDLSRVSDDTLLQGLVDPDLVDLR